MTTRLLKATLLITAAGVCAPLVSAPAYATHAQPPANPATAPAADAIPPATRAALEKSLAAYKALSTYRDKQVTRFEIKFKGGPDANQPQMLDQETTVAWAAPNKLAMVSPFVSIHSDGTRVYCSIPSIFQYTEHAVPASFEPEGPMDFESASPADWLAQHDVASLLMRSPTDPAAALINVRSWGEARPDTLDGKPGVRIAGVHSEAALPGVEQPIGFSVFVADESGLILEIRRDVTEIYRESMGHGDDEDAVNAAPKPELERAELVLRYSDVQVNQPIPDAEFVFKVGEGMKKVEQFDMRGDAGPDPQKALIGKPAPAIRARMLDGSDFDLASLKGRIVLLDFWATWCGPCVQAMPKVQKVAEKFADRNVTILGVNSDGGDTKKVSAFLEKRKISLGQVMDADGSIGSAYAVTGIPCMVFIDAEGVVQDVHVGAGPSIERELTQAIEKLLRGEALHTPEQIAAFRGGSDHEAGVHADDAVVAPGDGPVALKPIGEAMLKPGQTLRAGGAWSSFQRDIDGDGRNELLVPDAMGGLTIISSNGASARSIRFSGVGPLAVTSALPATLAGAPGWLVCGTKQGPLHGQAPLVGFFDADGRSVWTHTPDFGPSSSVQAWVEAADLDGNGTTEVVVLCTGYELRSVRPNEFEHVSPRSVLIILDHSGGVVSRRQVGQSAQGLFIATPSEPGKPRPIVVTGSEGVRTYTFDAAAAGGQADQE
ncbi:MAG: TlpA family protein disulfide reductase [Phycisphaerales bacterium]